MIKILLMYVLGLCGFFILDRWVVEIPRKKQKRLEIIRWIGTFFVTPILYYGMNQSFLYTDEAFAQNPLWILGLFCLVNLGAFFLDKKTRTNKKWVTDIAKILFLVLVLEGTLFNYKHYLTLTREEVSVSQDEIEVYKKEGQVLTQKKENQVKIKPVKVVEAKIKIKGTKVRGIYLDAYDKKDKLVKYDISVDDQASGKKILLNETTSYQGIPSSFYKNIYNPYESDYLYLTFAADKNVEVRGIHLNPVVPLTFSAIRVGLLSAFLILGYILRPSSLLFQKKVIEEKKLVKKTTIILVSIAILLSLGITHWNPTFRGNRYFTYDYVSAKPVNVYQKLAEALAHGKVHLLDKPASSLIEMENPYNIDDREKTLEAEGEEYFWDTAYYNGRYYVYFGVVPVLFTYLPFYLCTGHHLSNNMVIFLGLAGIILSLVAFCKKMVERYGKSLTIGTYLYLLLITLFGSHFLFWYIAQRPDFYSIPIVWGIMFSLLGMTLWLHAQKEEKPLEKKWLFLGSLSMALVAGCRPQLLLISFAAIPIFFKDFKEKKILSKNSWKETLAFVLPYVIVAISLMMYNYVRFGSIFDFGANYNLTTNDMTKRGFEFERIGLGFYYFLFAFPLFQNVFPFVKMLPLSTSYIGITIYETMFGGVVTMMPLFLFGLLFFRFKKYFKEKLPYYLAAIFTISTGIIIFADTNMAGILPRYCLDFAWLLALSTYLVLLHIIEGWKGKKEYIQVLNKVLFGVVMISLIYNFFLLFIDVSYSYKSTLPTFFYHFYYLFQFWL